MATQLDRIEDKLDNVLEWINGNDKPGAKVRLDRLEQTVKRFKTTAKAFWTAIVAIASTAIYSLFK